MVQILTKTKQVSLKDVIRHVVNTHQGLRGVELTMKVMEIKNPVLFSNFEFSRTLQELVEEGEIVELEYVLPNIDYRIKTIYFPKGTQLNVKNSNQVRHNAKTQGI